MQSSFSPFDWRCNTGLGALQRIRTCLAGRTECMPACSQGLRYATCEKFQARCCVSCDKYRQQPRVVSPGCAKFVLGLIQLVLARLARHKRCDPKHHESKLQFEGSRMGLNEDMHSLTQCQHLYQAGVPERRARSAILWHLRLNTDDRRKCDVLRELELQAQL